MEIVLMLVSTDSTMTVFASTGRNARATQKNNGFPRRRRGFRAGNSSVLRATHTKPPPCAPIAPAGV